jgi:hypothetical protein
LPKKNWRINDLLGKLDMAIGHSTIVNGQSVCTITLDTTEYYMIANEAQLKRENLQSKITNDGFFTTIENKGAK